MKIQIELVSVAERLPPEAHYVVIVFQSDHLSFDVAYQRGGTWFSRGGPEKYFGDGNPVLYWFECPKLPTMSLALTASDCNLLASIIESALEVAERQPNFLKPQLAERLLELKGSILSGKP